jgi:hypothetical protein
VIVVVMGGAVRVGVSLAAVIVDANVTFGQAMRDAGVGGESEGGRRRENAKHVERGKDDRRFGAKGLSLVKTDSISRREHSIHRNLSS